MGVRFHVEGTFYNNNDINYLYNTKISLTGFQLLISAGKFLPLIAIIIHSNSCSKGE